MKYEDLIDTLPFSLQLVKVKGWDLLKNFVQIIDDKILLNFFFLPWNMKIWLTICCFLHNYLELRVGIYTKILGEIIDDKKLHNYALSPPRGMILHIYW